MTDSNAAIHTNARTGSAGLRRRLLAGFGAQGLQFSIRVVQQILLVPLFIGSWGKPLYEDWIVLFAAAAFVPMLELGTQAYFGNLLLACWASGDIPGFRRALHVALGVHAVIVGLACLAAGLAAVLIDWPATVGTITLSPGAALTTLLVLALGNLGTVPQGVVNTIYRARGDFSRLVNMGTLLLVLETGGMAVALLLGGTPVTVAAVYSGAIGLTWLLVIFDQRRRYPDIRYGLAMPGRMELAKIAAKAPYYLVNSATNIVVMNGPIIILELLAPAGAVAAFSTSRILVGTLRQIAHQLAHASGVEMSRQFTQGEFAALRRLFLATGRLAAGVFGLLGGALLAGGGAFFAIWTRGEVAFDPWLFGLLLAGVYLTIPGQPAFTMLFYTNRPRPISVAYGGYAVAGLVLCGALSPVFSGRGAAAALSLAEFIMIGFWLTAISTRVADVRLGTYLGKTYAVGGVSFGMSFCIASPIISLLHPRSLADLVVFGLAWGVLAAVPAWFLLLTKAQRSWVLAAGLRRPATKIR